ncbi:septum formation initiator family protein [Candidatus Uhrbacteria bacterium]|nr:septum formation initiator family protein [Candidatus Uhrbacteria bacterium]
MAGRRITWRRFFESRLFFAGGIVALIFLSVSFTRARIKDRSIRQEMEALQSQVDALQGEQNQLTDLITLFERPDFLEKEARRVLGYVKPGEEVVVIEGNVKCEIENGKCVDKNVGKNALSNPRKWWEYFFGDS